MNKKLAAALSGGAVLVLTLSGCSDDSDNKVNDWAKKVCDQVQPQLQKINNANASILEKTGDNNKPADVQKADSVAFQEMSEAYKALGTAVDSAGPPPVDGGEATQKAAVKELNASSKAYADLKTQVDALDTKEQSKFADGLKTIADELNKISTGGDQALRKLQSGEVGVAMSKQEGCQKQTASTGPSGSGAADGDDASPDGSAPDKKESDKKESDDKESEDKGSADKGSADKEPAEKESSEKES
ncbi:small secreted protein [Streptomyces sp. Tue 6075]|uniref:small secreted protein n=1 Tax=Streptomyces sp. Tue 6075 TaxID=1661694 RepID=UPI00094A4529|nr:small secreted protein [Streptomyces sp. Tue 6075]APS20128.1 small secreted protein [Streptomyces sp. Tue 6075]